MVVRIVGRRKIGGSWIVGAVRLAREGKPVVVRIPRWAKEGAMGIAGIVPLETIDKTLVVGVLDQASSVSIRNRPSTGIVS